jgi:hypothetical protein
VHRSTLFGTIAIATAFVTLVFAQPKKGGAPKKPTPKVEASATDNPYEGATAADAAKVEPASTADASGPIPPPSGVTTVGDGGVRPSPLNPAPEEMPSGKLLDAGPVDYDKLIADIAALRARVSAVGDSMFRSRVAVSIETSGDHAKIGRLQISLDDGVVFTAPANFRADDETPVYSAGVAAGRHAITVDVDRKDDRGDAFRTSQRSRFMVDVPRDQELAISIRIWDDSNMGKDFPSDQSGRYELKVRLDAKARAPSAKK